MERFSLYKQVHKGIRSVVSGLVEQAGRTDFRSPEEVAQLKARLDSAFEVFESHAAHETEFITPVLVVCLPQLAADSEAEHREQEMRLRDLRSAFARVVALGSKAPALGHAFVVALSRFEGELLLHMADEEERLMPALWARLEDDALRRIHEALLASLPPEEKARAFGWMLPALSAPERAELLAGVRAVAPPESFAALQGLARRVMPAEDWNRLEQALLATAA